MERIFASLRLVCSAKYQQEYRVLSTALRKATCEQEFYRVSIGNTNEKHYNADYFPTFLVVNTEENSAWMDQLGISHFARFFWQ